ncbi:MAG: 2-oxoglutarate-dependent dioxygenase [Lysobacteraceae bacterium]|nr:MAG: 2-oxoglutarate-dependent dioxygenase [Xanthomonadaceae bacterium]
MAQPDYSEIKRWIAEQIRAGQPANALLEAMRGRGWSHEQAMALIAQAMGASAGTAAVEATAAQTTRTSQSPAEAQSHSKAAEASARALPTPAIEGDALHLDLGDRKVSVLMAMRNPQILLFGDFLSKDECDRLVEIARPRMQRSLTTDIRTGADKVDTVRTSRGMFFGRGETPLVAAVEARIARLLAWPVENGEHLQVLHYRPGERYEPHYDYFDPNGDGTGPVLARGGQRVATLLMYLREPERGGDTTFPDLGLRFGARRGCALFFSYPNPHPSSMTRHGGAPVVAGEKWVATKWLREREFV